MGAHLPTPSLRRTSKDGGLKGNIMKKPTIINGIGFETQKAAKDYTRKLLLKLEPIGLIGTTIKEWEIPQCAD